MKKGLLLLASVVLILPSFVWAATAVSGSEPAPDFPAVFEQLKGLVGTWQGVSGERAVKVTYHTTGRGSALVESFYPAKGDAPSSMSSVYHLDGDDLMVTHYCGAGNQPRMKAVSHDPDTGVVRFGFIDITNLSEPSAYHTREVVLTLQDEDHLKVEFNGTEKGKESPASFELTRAR